MLHTKDFMKKLLLKNCRLYNKLSDLPFDILIEGRTISKIQKNISAPDDSEIIDVKNNIIVPGFIDLHIQGAGGSDVLDNTVEALRAISKTLAATGTTAFLGTTVVKPAEGNAHLKLAREWTNKDLSGAMMLGVHLEGPFINVNKKGGLAADSIYESSAEKLEEIFIASSDSLKMMTIAPELKGNLEIIKKLKANNVVPSFAHSDADYEEAKKGFDSGINHVTHIFNAMPPFHHRAPSPLTAIFESDTITAQIISDGHHLHPGTVKILYKLLGAERCVCITDGMHGIGLPDGKYIYNGKEYNSVKGAARYFDGTLIGSTTSLGNIAFKFKEFTGCTFEEAINSVSINPAKVLGIDDKKGSLEIGKDADIVLLNDDNSILLTIVEGKIRYRK